MDDMKVFSESRCMFYRGCPIWGFFTHLHRYNYIHRGVYTPLCKGVVPVTSPALVGTLTSITEVLK